MRLAQNILSSEGLAELREFVASERCLIALDFDGTLAPIVDSPNSAAIDPNVEAGVQRLASVCEILILTGRSVADVRQRIPNEVKYILGNHGCEGNQRVTSEMLSTARETTKKWLDTLCQRFVNDKVFLIEDKEYSLAIHFRLALFKRWARIRAQNAARMLFPAALILDGKCVVNVIPPGLPDKYSALSAFMEDFDFKKAIFVGDDVTDNQIFRAKDSRILSVKVGQVRDLLAPWYIQKQELIVDLIQTVTLIRKGASVTNG